jgi:hypothetical protein
MRLYANVSDTVSNSILSVNLTESHDASTAVATVLVPTGGTNLTLGDYVTIDLGYTTQHQMLFQGYVKKLDRSAPEGTMSVTAYDVLTRAIDYFIVSPTADPFVQQNIETGDLIKYVLGMSGLTDFDFDNTSFIFATGGSKAEINLVGAYDYSKQLSDLIAWNLWAEYDGTVYLKNRKPFPMDGSLHQPGEVTDVGKYYGSSPVSLGTLSTKDILSISLSKNERDLRNKVVIYGANGLTRSASRSDSFDPILNSYVQVLPTTPSVFYKSVCLSSLIITDGTFAQDACDYNLALMNRVGYDITLTVVGRPYYHARRVVDLTYAPLGISGSWYIYACDHEFNRNGYTCNLVLKK